VSVQRRRTCLGWLAILVLVLAAAAAMAGPAAAGGAERRCFFVVAGKAATADGSVLMGYSNDWGAFNWMAMRIVHPQAGATRFIKFFTKEASAEGGINDHQLGLLFGAETDLDTAVKAADPYIEGGWGFNMWDWVLGHCGTAREAIDMLGEMARTRGFAAEAAGSLAVADTHEAWVFELLGGRRWVAARVPDDSVWIHPNMVCIREVDLSDPDRFRGSADLVQHAIDLGRYDPASGPFDVAWAYADRVPLQAYYNVNRLWGAVHLLAPSLGLPTSTPWARLPVCVVPDRKVTRQKIVAIDRYHYKGTAFDQTDHNRRMSPHRMTTRPICARYTDYSIVVQLRDWLPDAIGGVVWVAQSRPCSSTFVPFYAGITKLPKAWRNATAYYAFLAVARRLDGGGRVAGVCRYGHYLPLVRHVYGAYERKRAKVQARVEAIAWRLTGTARIVYLNKYSATCAARALYLARSLPPRMR
jgi:dipeptidase